MLQDVMNRNVEVTVLQDMINWVFTRHNEYQCTRHDELCLQGMMNWLYTRRENAMNIGGQACLC